MKHTYHKIAVLTAMLTLTFTACKKSFLEIIPKGQLVARTTADYSLLLSNVQLLNVSNANAQVTMGDEVAAIDPYFTSAILKTQASFRWEPVLYLPNQDAGEMVDPLQNIYLYNKVINEVPNAANGTEAQKLSVAAEAMGGRAWTYFLLINYYGKPYNAATASTDPGFPIVQVADVTATNFTRASVQQVYDFIISDLVTAIPRLPAQISNRTRMSKATAEGLLGKVYMFMGRFKDALPLLNAAVNDMANQSTPVKLYDYNVEFNTGGVFTPVDNLFGPSSVLLPDNSESLYSKQFFNPNFNEIVITPQTAALYGPSDLRLKFFVKTLNFSTVTYPVPGVLRRWGTFTTLFGFQIPDLYLLRAECRCRMSDLVGANADLETLRRNRMPASDAPVPLAIAGQQIPLLRFIIDERTREFAVQGYRWFDMRRLSVDPLFSSDTYKHTLYSATGSTTTFQLKPERFVLQFPQKVIDQHPGMANNP